MNSRRSLVKVTSNQISLVDGLNAFITALNPLGAIAQTVAEIMACRVEIKRIQQEREAIRLEYEARNRAIDATLEVALRMLEDRRIAMERFFDHAEREMRQHHIYGNQLVRTLQNMNQLVVQRDLSFEEKQLAHESIRVLSRQLVDSQKAGERSLAILVEITRRDLQALPSVRKLLPSDK